MKLIDLSTLQLDGIKEVANIGGCHGATALSQLTKKSVMVNVPSVKVLKLEDVLNLFPRVDQVVASVLIFFLGDITGRSMLLLEREHALHLVDILLGKKTGTTKTFTELESSTFKEATNIINCAYMNSLSDFLGFLILPTVPTMVVDTAAAILTSTYLNFSTEYDYILCIETQFEFPENGMKLSGYYILIPDPKSLDKILETINLKVI